MHKNASPEADKTPQTSPEAPSTTFIQLDSFHAKNNKNSKIPQESVRVRA